MRRFALALGVLLALAGSALAFNDRLIPIYRVLFMSINSVEFGGNTGLELDTGYGVPIFPFRTPYMFAHFCYKAPEPPNQSMVILDIQSHYSGGEQQQAQFGFADKIPWAFVTIGPDSHGFYHGKNYFGLFSAPFDNKWHCIEWSFDAGSNPVKIAYSLDHFPVVICDGTIVAGCEGEEPGLTADWPSVSNVRIGFQFIAGQARDFYHGELSELFLYVNGYNDISANINNFVDPVTRKAVGLDTHADTDFCDHPFGFANICNRGNVEHFLQGPADAVGNPTYLMFPAYGVLIPPFADDPCLKKTPYGVAAEGCLP